MPKTLILSILFILTLSGCSFRGVVSEVEKDLINTDRKVVLSEEPLDAEFYVDFSITGGMGSMPIVQHNQNLSVYLEETYFDLISDKMPSCIFGSPLVKIFAKVHLIKKTGINESIPPDEFGNQPEENYYTLAVDKLYNIDVKVEECEE